MIKQKRALIIIVSVLVIMDISIVGILKLYNYYREETKPLVMVKKIISNNDLMLNKTDYFIVLGDTVELDVSNPKNVKYKLEIEDKEIVNEIDSKLTGLKNGKTGFSIKINNFNAFNGTIYVVNGLRHRDELFDKKKKFISCNEFNKEENDALDKTLKDRVEAVGVSTRAGVVEVARFITLEFDRRIPYFYENGRLRNYGETNYVDGEGRYYHKGLYLNNSRYASIAKRYTGPGSWGCRITQYQDEPKYGFAPRTKMPNGFDCSGFISWVLYNGGFDVGDVGAGDIASRKDDLYDLGEKNRINNQLLDSGKVKVGDLIAYPGHMAIIAGIDKENDLYYVAESLPQFRGVVLNKYRRVGLKATFTHIMLMDSVYKEDGNLTNMWY